MIDLKPSCRLVVEILAHVSDDQLTSPTPCAEYSVGDIIDHLDGVARGFTSFARKEVGEGTDTAPSGAYLRPDWRDSVAKHVRVLGEAWDDPVAWEGSSAGPGLELPNELWGRIALTEMVVHGWDLATATGQPFDLPEPTLRACLDHVLRFVPNAPVEGLWGRPVEVPSGAPLIDRIVAGTGRTP